MEDIALLAHTTGHHPYTLITGIPKKGKILSSILVRECQQAQERLFPERKIEIHNTDTNLLTEVKFFSNVNHGYLIVYIVDDVINTGKTMFTSLNLVWNAIVTAKLENRILAVRTVTLVDRDHKLFPVKSDLTGITISTRADSRVEVVFKDNMCTQIYLRRAPLT